MSSNAADMRRAVIKNADMSEEHQQYAVDVATTALSKFNIEKDVAAYIKKEFDKKHCPTWHCIVGRNYGSYVTHETKHFIYFYVSLSLPFFLMKLFCVILPLTFCPFNLTLYLIIINTPTHLQ